MDHLMIYIACVLGAAGLHLVVATKQRPMRLFGAILGAAGVAWIFARLLMLRETDMGGDLPGVLFYIFAVIAIASAVRMITHERPVYCALYFVMVVLSSAAIFLLLEAEFMAFALIIVYAGAILITYLFVIMLAQQAPSELELDTGGAVYDRLPREPLAASVVGFFILAVLTQSIFDQRGGFPPPSDSEARHAAIVSDLNALPKQRDAVIGLINEHLPEIPIESELVEFGDDYAIVLLPPSFQPQRIDFEAAGIDRQAFTRLLPQNIDSVGVALVVRFPVSLELAGVILLLAMFGAVVLARKQIEFSEDEKRERAGMRRIAADTDESTGGGA